MPADKDTTKFDTTGYAVLVQLLDEVSAKNPALKTQMDDVWAQVSLISQTMEAEKLRSTQQFYESIIMKAPDGVVVIDPEGNFKYISPSAHKLFDYPKTFVPPSAMELTHPDDLPLVLSTMEKLLANPDTNPILEYRFRHYDGSWVWIESTLSDLLDDDSVRGIVINFRDITERKQSEKLLIASEAKHRILLETMNEVVVQVDNDDVIQYINGSCFDVYGYKPEELVGKIGYEYLIHTDDANLIQEKNKSRERGLADTYEVRGKTRSGETIWLKVSGTPMRNTQGEVIGSLGVMSDITQSKRLMEKLLASQKMDAIALLAGGVAHDFNNLLTIMMGYADDILLSLAPESPLLADVDEIIKAGKQASILTQQLLSFSRNQVLQPKVFDLNERVDYLKVILPRLIGSQVKLETSLATNLNKIKADMGQIDQVIVNLSLNAKNAMPQGGTLTIETANTEIDREYSSLHADMNPGHYVMLSISDTGCGMDKETQARIFEPFFTTQDKGRGTGLGLSTVYGIVQQSEGYILVFSDPGIGTTMKILLPADYSMPETKAPEILNAITSNALIMVVDDEEAICMLIKKMLEKLGFRLEVASSGVSALNAINSGLRPDLMITDIVMPGMNGKELADKVFSIIPEQKVLFMSGFTDNVIVHRDVKNQHIPFIHKPFTSKELISQIHKLLNISVPIVSPKANVLILDDDENIIILLSRTFVKRGHKVCGAGSLEEALAILNQQEFDVLIVDMRLLGITGIAALQKIRDAGYTTPAIMMSGAVELIAADNLEELGVLTTMEKSSNNGPVVDFVEQLLQKQTKPLNQE